MSSNYQSKTLSHLGLVAGMCDHLGISSVIDQLIDQDETQQLVSDGTCVKALILNGLGFVERRLYLVSHFFSDKPTEHLLGTGVEAHHLNDDRLARCLDALYDYGLSKLFTHISYHACKQLGLDRTGSASFLHLDSSSFHVDGQYNQEAGTSSIEICPGYSRDHRPDLNQVILNLVVEQSSGIPVQMEALSGNTSDKISFRHTIQRHISQFKSDDVPVCWVADSALYTQENLREISAQAYWLSRVPGSIQEAKYLLETVVVDEMQAFEQAALSTYRYQLLGNAYGGVRQCWLVIFSQQAYARELKTLHKTYQKGTLQEWKAFETLQKQVFHCQQDAQKALSKFTKTLKYSQLLNTVIVPIYAYGQAGRPAKNAQKSLTGFQIQASIASSCQKYQQDTQKLGKFILATNDLREQWSPAAILQAYKNQSKVEKGFRFLKDKQFLASTLFVKKAQRIEAILMIMTLCLMVYAALEKELRQKLREKNETIPNQLKKPVQNPTMRWVFALFTGIHCLYVEKQTLILNLNEVHIKVIKLFGQQFEKYYQIE